MILFISILLLNFLFLIDAETYRIWGRMDYQLSTQLSVQQFQNMKICGAQLSMCCQNVKIKIVSIRIYFYKSITFSLELIDFKFITNDYPDLVIL